MLKLELVYLREVSKVRDLIVLEKLVSIENDRYTFFISCPICKNRFNYEVNILVSCPKEINAIKVYCPYKHSFVIKIKKIINDDKLLVEIKEI